ncbi:putative TadZ/CpaE, associated with Flp pilus assembly [Georgfuchsia toluolica]|uniref:TadZ/CpaE, associated with Flp pilus assembly n=1 Tax=Georgfuchsia toluolica TaxID=424218 RepID=A0A916J1D0_9PROT|nr:TadE/TadG family type IV pilus assembly protein [Georgfuchsia toluolica]CAG4882902.1 putative TadZ/CpaE, associated with Flp pilus assembly [Georgfuchsia toluolica]
MNKKQSGATMVEFALVLIVFLMFLLGITDFARMLYTWGAANEASRNGARFAAICDDTNNKAKVLARMQGILPQIGDINLEWNPANCTPATCEGVTVTITSLNYQWISPIAGSAALAAIPMPTFSTFQPREIMKQDPMAAPSACS